MRESLALLSAPDRRKYWIAQILQVATALMDLAGILLFGLVGVLAASTVQGGPVPAPLQSVLDGLGYGDEQPLRLAVALAILAAGLLLARGLVTLYITRRVGLFLARCAFQVSTRLTDQFFSLPLYRVQHYPSQFVSFALGPGVNAAVIDILASAMGIRSEIALIVLLGVMLLFVDPVTTAVVTIFFLLVMLLLTRGLRGWARASGEIVAETDIQAISSVQDGISTYREITVAGHQDYYARRFRDVRARSTRSTADQRYITMMPRYIMEMAMVLGGAILVLTVALTQDTAAAIGSLVLFMAASARLLPSLLRLNGGRLAVHSLRPRAEKTFELAEFCADQDSNGLADPDVLQTSSQPEQGTSRPSMSITVDKLEVRYPGAGSPAIRDICLDLPAGGRLAVVGPSGAGKSTLVDAILGVAKPTAGSITIGGLPSSQLIARWPGSIAYVPQDVALVSGTVRDNVALGVERSDIDDEQVWRALERASLARFLRESREGLDTVVGDRGVRLSGGQRQRMGIARALFNDPGLIVLDEATSALDAETEHVITSVLNGIGRDVTTITVAHRLATIREADEIVYMEQGEVLARGTFEEVRSAIPQFNRQAALLGL